jgi:hypothetical protein
MKNDIQIIIEIPLETVQSKSYNTNIKRYGEHNNSCLICGKVINENSPFKSVQLLNNGNLISTGQPFDDSQGFFMVGYDCANKLVVKFAF